MRDLGYHPSRHADEFGACVPPLHRPPAPPCRTYPACHTPRGLAYRTCMPMPRSYALTEHPSFWRGRLTPAEASELRAHLCPPPQWRAAEVAPARATPAEAGGAEGGSDEEEGAATTAAAGGGVGGGAGDGVGGGPPPSSEPWEADSISPAEPSTDLSAWQ